MAIPYSDQNAIVHDTGVRARVESGVLIVALNIGALPPISGTAAQIRTALANKVIATSPISNPTYALDQFCWAIVGTPALTSVQDLTDNQIRTLISNNWDAIAAALIQPGGP